MKLIGIIFLLPVVLGAQRCNSVSSAMNGEWKPISSAPRDGTVVEIMQTYGVAPTFGLYKWTKKYKAPLITRNEAGEEVERKIIEAESKDPQWIDVNNPGHGVSYEPCLFWRKSPYPSIATHSGSTGYVDPTNGAQNTVKYWCDALHMKYDAKKDRCVR